MEYKFRGKNLHTGEWEFGHYLTKKLCDGQDRHHYIKSDGNDGVEVISGSVGLFAFVGKDNVDIYDGDMVKMHQFLFDGVEVENELTGIVKQAEFGWMLTSIKCEPYSRYTGEENGSGESYILMFHGLHEESFEVIGNIHDHPDI